MSIADLRDDTRNTLVPGWTLVRQDDLAPKGQVIRFYRRDDLFCFVVEKWFGPWTDEGGAILDDGYWSVEKRSGLFTRLEDAEQEAQRDLLLQTHLVALSSPSAPQNEA